jgi:hypothetical protein
MRSEDIISDAEITRVHANANFGPRTTKRRVVDEGVLQCALGFTTGHTMMSILLEHGLLRKPKPGAYATTLTAKGKRYARSMVGSAGIRLMIDAAERSTRSLAMRAATE